MGEVEQKQKNREKEPKYNRNLYLAIEGIIRECKSTRWCPYQESQVEGAGEAEVEHAEEPAHFCVLQQRLCLAIKKKFSCIFAFLFFNFYETNDP
jgi:hypothetical protein